MKAAALCAAALAGLLAVPGALAQSSVKDARPDTLLELTVGALKENAEASAVRALVKYGDRVSEEDRLSNATGTVFYEVTRLVKFDVSDKGAFSGLSLRYGAKAYKVPLVERVLPNGEKALVSDSAGWMHIFPVTLGVDADRSFQNRDVLLEAGYVPFKGRATPSCFKLGGNPAIGLSAQLGRRSREATSEPPEGGSSLRRLKAEALLNFKLGCFRSTPAPDAAADEEPKGSLLGLFAKDLADVQVMVEARRWRDYALHESFKYASLTLRVPTGKGAFMDFRREVGAEAPTFAKGSQFGAYLTVQF